MFSRKKRQIIESGWRWKIAQWALWVLYGRAYHYISPWHDVGLTAGAILVQKSTGKIGLLLRDETVEASGKYSIAGGFLRIKLLEDQVSGLLRELKEEIHLTVEPSRLSLNSPRKSLHVTHGENLNERADYTKCATIFWLKLSDEEVAQIRPGKETKAIHWFSPTEVWELIFGGSIAFRDVTDALKFYLNALEA